MVPRRQLVSYGAVFLLFFAVGGWWLNRAAGVPVTVAEPAAAVIPPASITPGPVTESVLLPPPPQVDSADIRALLPADKIRAIDDPQYETPTDAAPFLLPDERLISVTINGDTRAYPINVLSAHEIVNDVIGGVPVAVTWCPLCYSAVVFGRLIEEQPAPLTFGVSGSLLFNTLVMFDRETDTLWSQLYGGAIAGSLVGTPLRFFQSINTDWATWASVNSTGLVLSKVATCTQFQCAPDPNNPAQAYAIDPYRSYYNTADRGVLDNQIVRPDDEGGSKELVLGVRVGEHARAYPYSILAQQPLIQDELGGQAIVVWFDPESGAGAAYLRNVDGDVIDFQLESGTPAVLEDSRTGRRWLADTGVPLTDSGAARPLTPAPTTAAFAFGWFGYFPNSETFPSS